MNSPKRSFLKLIAALGGATAGFTKFFVPEVFAQSNTTVVQRLRSQPSWTHQYLDNGDLERMFAAAHLDPDVPRLLALTKDELVEAGPIGGDRYHGPYPIDMLRIPYTDADEEEALAWLFLGTIQIARNPVSAKRTNFDVYPIKGIAFKNRSAYVIDPFTQTIVPIEDDEKKVLFMDMLFGRTQEGKSHAPERRTSLKNIVAPCLPQDCLPFCSSACDVGEGFFVGTVGLGLAAGAKIIPPAGAVGSGIVFVAFGNACYNCWRHCRRFNIDCCAQLRDLGLVE